MEKNTRVAILMKTAGSPQICHGSYMSTPGYGLPSFSCSALITSVKKPSIFSPLSAAVSSCIGDELATAIGRFLDWKNVNAASNPGFLIDSAFIYIYIYIHHKLIPYE